MMSDRYLNHADLQDIASRVQNGLPLHFDPRLLEHIVATMQKMGFRKQRAGLFTYAFFAAIAAVLGGAILVVTTLALRLAHLI
jgi:hypothetical protein